MEYKGLITIILALVIIYSVLLFYLMFAVSELKKVIKELDKK